MSRAWDKGERLKAKRALAVMFAIWIAVVVMIGGILTSYHQPFREPADTIASLSITPQNGQWHLLHILSGACGCSQTVMRHLLKRGKFADLYEEVIVVDGEAPDLRENAQLLIQLGAQGFEVTHVRTSELPGNLNLLGVPLLIILSPNSRVAYKGGYGMQGDKDAEIFEAIRSNRRPHVLPVRGCAVGSSVRTKADPFHWKY